MFGYHDSNRCYFDLWAPESYHSCENADPVQKGYRVWEDTPHRCAIDNRAFSAYCFHSQEVEDVINLIGSGATSIQCDDDMSEADMRYIENEVRSRYGLDISLS